jgi:hypothetical protein
LGRDQGAYKKRGKQTPPSRDRILVQEFPSERDALQAEIFLIAYYGRKGKGGILINWTDGGEGTSGWVPTVGLRNRWSEQRKGKYSGSEKSRLKISQSLRGNQNSAGRKPWVPTKEQRRKMKIAATGKAKCLGKKRSEKTKLKIAASMQGNTNARRRG